MCAGGVDLASELQVAGVLRVCQSARGGAMALRDGGLQGGDVRRGRALRTGDEPPAVSPLSGKVLGSRAVQRRNCPDGPAP